VKNKETGNYMDKNSHAQFKTFAQKGQGKLQKTKVKLVSVLAMM
jgi:hypothetical protein